MKKLLLALLLIIMATPVVDGTSKDLGVGAFGSGDSATKAFTVEKTVTKFVIEMPSPSNGNDIWSEISILVIPD